MLRHFRTKTLECQVGNNEHFRHLLLYELNRGSKAAEAAQNIRAVYGEDSVTERTTQQMVCTLQARQFWHEWHSALGAASGGIRRGLSIMNCLRGTWPSLLNAIVNNFAVWKKQSGKNARVDDMEWFFSMTTLYQTLQTWRKRPFRNDWEILSHPPYFSDLAPSDYHLFCSLSNNLRGVSFDSDAELQNWLDEFFTTKPADFFKRWIENLPERWKSVVNNWEYIIDWIFVWKINYL
jgi:hypothetical protein